MLVRADKKWDYGIGMIKVDGLEPTEDMKKLIEKEKKRGDFYGRSTQSPGSKIQDEGIVK